jgi:alanine dehydrogenase
MILGVPVEIKPNENRVSMTPYAVYSLTRDDHQVLIQDNAGIKSGFTNEEYTKNGATIVGTLD